MQGIKVDLKEIKLRQKLIIRKENLNLNFPLNFFLTRLIKINVNNERMT